MGRGAWDFNKDPGRVSSCITRIWSFPCRVELFANVAGVGQKGQKCPKFELRESPFPRIQHVSYIGILL